MRLAGPCSSAVFSYIEGMRTTCLAALAVALLGACTTPRIEPVQPAPIGSLAALQSCGGLYMGGQPTQADLEALAARGVRRVINLRKEGEFQGYDERACATSLGLEYLTLQFSTSDELTDAVLARARELLAQANAGGTLLHCGSGNRVGALWLAHRTLDIGLAWEDALREAQAVGLKNQAYTERIRAYVESARR
ncbi:MAG: hypothetical protein FJ298_04350 [Planctomycetes bacterium]|nr:hypothetical protein [Planctomycetota bacterium]